MIKRIKNIIPQKNSPKQDAMFRKLKEEMPSETSGFRTSVLPGGCKCSITKKCIG